MGVCAIVTLYQVMHLIRPTNAFDHVYSDQIVLPSYLQYVETFSEEINTVNSFFFSNGILYSQNLVYENRVPNFILATIYQKEKKKIEDITISTIK